MSVVVRTPEGKDRIICQGRARGDLSRGARASSSTAQLLPMDHAHIEELRQEYERLSADGFRVLAIATKDVAPRGRSPATPTPYGKADECDLILQGYVAFLDPPKETAAAAIAALQGHGVAVKVITGDNDLVARKICKEVGLPTDVVLLGGDVETMTDAELAEAAEKTTLFARVSPAHKQRIIQALQSREHTVGFMGDGINDAPALHAADVGISVDTAVDIAKESADMILLEKSLLVLDEGVLEGRKVFANIIKYVRMGASSNFGNMFSVLGRQRLRAVPADAADPDPGQQPALRHRPDRHPHRRGGRRTDPAAAAVGHQASSRGSSLFIGPCSSIFDYTTYLHDALRLRLLGRLDAGGRGAQREPVPDRLVRREPADADADHPRHSHQQDPVPAEPRRPGRCW